MRYRVASSSGQMTSECALTTSGEKVMTNIQQFFIDWVKGPSSSYQNLAALLRSAPTVGIGRTSSLRPHGNSWQSSCFFWGLGAPPAARGRGASSCHKTNVQQTLNFPLLVSPAFETLTCLPLVTSLVTTSSSSKMFGISLLWIIPYILSILPYSTSYDIVRDYSGSTFFDLWDFYGSWDNLTLGTRHKSPLSLSLSPPPPFFFFSKATFGG